MIDLLSVYICPKCGEILEDQKTNVTEIDCENDEVFEIALCDKCGHEVTQKREYSNGKSFPVFRKVEHERWLWATGFFDSDADRERLEGYL